MRKVCCPSRISPQAPQKYNSVYFLEIHRSQYRTMQGLVCVVCLEFNSSHLECFKVGPQKAVLSLSSPSLLPTYFPQVPKKQKIESWGTINEVIAHHGLGHRYNHLGDKGGICGGWRWKSSIPTSWKPFFGSQG